MSGESNSDITQYVDEFIVKKYKSGVRTLQRGINGDPTVLSNAINDVKTRTNSEIKKYVLDSLKLSEELASKLEIQVDDILEITKDAAEDLALLRNDPSNQEAQERLEELNGRLEFFCESAKYTVLYLELPEVPEVPEAPVPIVANKIPPVTTKNPPTKNLPTKNPPDPAAAKGYFANMWGFDPTISTTREANFAEGFSASGNQIMRYKAFFTPSLEKQKEGKKPRYQVLTFQEPKDGMPAQWRLESGSDVGEDAVEAYVKSSSALKMNKYYGEKVIQITYSKEFFAKYHTEFLYSLRKSDRTKSGRTMPPEYCILGFNYNGKKWWDLFSRSAYGNFWGQKRAGIRIGQWWTERGEEPSYRLDLEGGPKSSSVPMSGSLSTNKLRSDLRKEILKEVDTKLDTMKTDVQSSLDKLTDAISNLTQLVGDLTRRVAVSPIPTD